MKRARDTQAKGWELEEGGLAGGKKEDEGEEGKREGDRGEGREGREQGRR